MSSYQATTCEDIANCEDLVCAIVDYKVCRLTVGL
jgi:hypothetical protein